MEQITVIIPDPSTKAFVDQVVASGQYPSVSDYFLELLRNDQERRARLEALIIQGMKEGGESIVMTDEVWDQFQRNFEARYPETNQP
jgi:antitoxin ParD1/3/4